MIAVIKHFPFLAWVSLRRERAAWRQKTADIMRALDQLLDVSADDLEDELGRGKRNPPDDSSLR